MVNVNVSVSYLAPGLNNPECIAMLLYEKILDEYNANENGMAHVNTPDR